MDVDVFNDDGQSLVNEQGELVCKKVFQLCQLNSGKMMVQNIIRHILINLICMESR